MLQSVPMTRFYRALAKAVPVYAFMHPFVYLGLQYLAETEMRRKFETVMNGLPQGKSSVEAWTAGSLTPANVLFALLTAVALLAAGALFSIVASLGERAEPGPVSGD